MLQFTLQNVSEWCGSETDLGPCVEEKKMKSINLQSFNVQNMVYVHFPDLVVY